MLAIKILGSGCANCKNLERLCREVVEDNKLEAQIEKITDFKEIASYGIMSTPGLIVNGEILSSGKLPTKSSLQHWLMNSIKSNGE
jgi:small redox-active disulfide protein 2